MKIVQSPNLIIKGLMIEFIIEILFETICEIFLQVLAEISLELGLESTSHSLRRGRLANSILAGIGFILLGALAGFLTKLFLPERIIPICPFRGISLIISPIAAGVIMHSFGMWRLNRGHDPSLLATFWGGALFAFSMALVRWLMVGRII